MATSASNAREGGQDAPSDPQLPSGYADEMHRSQCDAAVRLHFPQARRLGKTSYPQLIASARSGRWRDRQRF